MSLPNNTWIADVKANWIERDYNREADQLKPLLLHYTDSVGLYFYYDDEAYEPELFHLEVWPDNDDDIQYFTFKSLNDANHFLSEKYNSLIPADILRKFDLDSAYYQARVDDLAFGY